MESVSASDIVRQFGHWQDRALAAPVYIRHHGRPKLVLTSIDFVEGLVADRAASHPRTIGDLLELVDSIVIVTDGDRRVAGMSPGARRYLARGDWHGRTLEDVLSDRAGPLIARSVVDVCDTGRAESFQLRTGAEADRRLDVTVQPFGDGACIVAQDRTADDERRESAALSSAVGETLQLLGTVAVLRINLRGFVTRASKSFETLSGLSPDAYRSVRVPTLFDIGTRMAVSEAFEKTVDLVRPQIVAARLNVNNGEARGVRMAFSAEMLRSSVDSIVATIEGAA